MPLQIDGINMTDIKVDNVSMNILQVDGVTKWVRSWTLTIASITGVATQSITRTSSQYAAAPTGSLSNGAIIYFGDVLYFEGTAAVGYNAPNIFTPLGDGYITINSDINTSDVYSAGSVLSYTFNIPTISNITNQVVSRSSSPLQGANTGQLYNGSGGSSITVYYGDILTFTATAATYYATSISSPKTINGTALTTASHIAAVSQTFTIQFSNIVGITGQSAWKINGDLSVTEITSCQIGETIYFTANALTGYNNPQGVGSGNAFTITTNYLNDNSGVVSSASHISTSVITFTFTKSTISNLTSYRVRRTSSPLQGAPSPTVLTGGEALYYNDVLEIDTLSPATGWQASVTTPINVINNIVTSSYITMSRKTYTVILNKQSGSGGTDSVISTWGLSMPAATAPSRSGYTFQGYHINTGGSGNKYYNANMSSARAWDIDFSSTLYAYWTANSGPYWSLSSGTYSATFTMQAYGDPGSEGAWSWLTANYPPGNYTLNYKVRVRAVDPDTFAVYGTYIFIRLQY